MITTNKFYCFFFYLHSILTTFSVFTESLAWAKLVPFFWTKYSNLIYCVKVLVVILMLVVSNRLFFPYFLLMLWLSYIFVLFSWHIVMLFWKKIVILEIIIIFLELFFFLQAFDEVRSYVKNKYKFSFLRFSLPCRWLLS